MLEKIVIYLTMGSKFRIELKIYRRRNGIEKMGI